MNGKGKNKSAAKSFWLSAIAVILIFLMFNLSVYMVFTRRLANNFSGASQAKMIDVGKYLPFENNSELARVDSSLKLT